MKAHALRFVVALLACLLAGSNNAYTSSSLPAIPGVKSRDDLERFQRRKLRASEVLFNVGYLYVAEGMNHVHADGDEKLAGAVLSRGFELMLLAREHHTEALALSKVHELDYSAPRLDANILQGSAPAREVLDELVKSYKVGSFAFAARMLEATLEAPRDLTQPVAEVIRTGDGEDAEKRFRRALEGAAKEKPDDRRRRLKDSALAELAEEYGLLGDKITVSAEGEAPVWDSARSGAAASEPAAPSAPPAAATATATGTSLPPVTTTGASRPRSTPEQEKGDNREGRNERENRPGRPPIGVPPPLPPRPPTDSRQNAAVQRAVESAAIAGARVRNEWIAMAAALNWEMRRALKDFLFNYTVRLPSATLACFPLDSTGATIPMCPRSKAQARYDFAWFDPRETVKEENGPFLPTVCATFEATNNYCAKAGAPGLPELAGGGSWSAADPISAVAPNPGNLEKLVATCEGRTQVNQYLLLKMLFGTDPGATKADRIDLFEGRSGLDRIGLLPRLAILRGRVQHLAGRWAALHSDKGYNAKDIEKLAKNPHSDAMRAALETARTSLRSAGLGDAEFELREVYQGPGEERFQDLHARVHVAASKFETRGTLDRGDCFQYRDVRVIPSLPIGIRAGKDLYQKYELTLVVKHKGETLRASAAAVPGRVHLGPSFGDVHAEEHELLGRAKATSGEIMNTLTTARFPNLPVLAEGDDSETGGFTRAEHLGYLRGAAAGTDSWALASRLAGAITPYEVSRYAPPCKFPGGAHRLKVPQYPPMQHALQSRVAEMLSRKADEVPLLKSWMPAALDQNLKHYWDTHDVPDPLLRNERKVADYARAKGGKPFTLMAAPDGEAQYNRSVKASGVCEPSASLVK